MRSSVALVALALIVIVAVVYVYFTYYQTHNNVFLSLIDPANVPYGTQSLSLTYSSLMVHTVSGNTSGWTSVSGSGTINLLSIVNVSTILGSLYLSNGSRIDMIRFNVTSSSIEINNTSYPVVLPNAQVTARVLSGNTVNGTMNLITELSPTVITVFTANSTVFIMVPSVRAVLVGNKNLNGLTPGSRHELDTKEMDALETSSLNMTLSNATLSSSANVTHLSITVTDNSNQSIVLKHVLVFGNLSVSADNMTISSSGNISREDNRGSNASNTSRDNISSDISNTERESETQGLMQADSRVINFLVNNSGSLFLPALGSEFEGNGYTLNAGQSITFNFTGEILLGENHILVNLATNTRYNVIVQGENGARATVNATAV